MKICTVLGARPQFIKSAPVSRAFSTRPDINQVIVHTGQHFDVAMSEVFFDELAIPRPAHNLGIAALPHGAMTGRMLEALEVTFREEAPDWVLVYGDTNSTIAAALAATKMHIPVAHVEAGLRSFNRAMPEEINRILTDHSADMLFTPTPTATKNLLAEGVAAERIVQSGDVMQDAASLFRGIASKRSDVLNRLGLTPKSFVLATIHRQENTDDPARLNAIVDGLGKAAQRIPVVLPMHPRTTARVGEFDLRLDNALRVISPIGFLEMIALEMNAAVIATDSGGVQKEAYFQRVPCVTLRDETEWTELLESGWNRLCSPTDAETIARVILSAIGVHGEDVSLYGDGNASGIILDAISRGKWPHGAPIRSS